MQLNIIKIQYIKQHKNLWELPRLCGLPPLVSFPEGEGDNSPGARGDVIDVQHHALPRGVGGPDVGVPGGDGALVFQHPPTGHSPQLITITYLLQSNKTLFKFSRSQKHVKSVSTSPSIHTFIIHSKYWFLNLNFIQTVKLWQI